MVAGTLLVVGCSPAGTDPAALADPGSYAGALFAQTNRVRAERGLPELESFNCARTAALDRVQDLLGLALEHAALDRVIADCAPPSAMAAENLSRTSAPADQVVAAWLASPSHANNLLSRELVQLGVGCLPDPPHGLLCSQVFLG